MENLNKYIVLRALSRNHIEPNLPAVKQLSEVLDRYIDSQLYELLEIVIYKIAENNYNLGASRQNETLKQELNKLIDKL